MAKKLIFFLIFVYTVFSLPKMGFATDYTSNSFKVVDPVIDYGGAVDSSSDNFKLTGSIGQIAIGTSSNSTFQLNSGFLLFSAILATPATTPAVVPVVVGGGNYSMYLESLVKLGIFPLLPTEVKPCNVVFDLNCDGSVGLKDFSIFLAVQNRPIPNPADFNKDNKIDFKDLSILLSGWTGKLLSFVEPVYSAILTRTGGPSSFRGEAAIFSLREISRRETVLKLQPQRLPLATSPNTAVTTFEAGKVPTPNVETLIYAITSAQAIHDAAIEGTNHGQYAVGSKAILQTAINAAIAVRDSAISTQADVDGAIAMLSQKPAVEKSGFFKTSVQFISNTFNSIMKLFAK